MRVWEMRCRPDLGIIIMVDGWMDVVVAGVLNFFSLLLFPLSVGWGIGLFYFSILLFSWGKGFDERLID